MKIFKLIAIIILGSLASCENNNDLENTTVNAVVINFIPDKCYCCWGWVIEAGSQTIKADSLPGISSLENTVFPFSVRITIGNKTRNCSDLSKHDYYKIEQCSLIK